MVTQKVKPLTKSEYELLASFRFALRQFLHFSKEAAAKVGLTTQQYQAMLATRGFPGRDYVTVTELARQMLIHHHSAVGLVDRLAGHGLVERRSDPHDRRRVYVALTAHGAQVLDELAAMHRAELARLGHDIHPFLESFLPYSVAGP